MALVIPDHAQVLALEIATTMLNFLTTNPSLLCGGVRRRIFREFLRPHGLEFVLRSNYEETIVRCVMAEPPRPHQVYSLQIRKRTALALLNGCLSAAVVA